MLRLAGGSKLFACRFDVTVGQRLERLPLEIDSLTSVTGIKFQVPEINN